MAMWFHQTGTDVVAAELYAPAGGAKSEAPPAGVACGFRLVSFRTGTRTAHVLIATGEKPIQVNGRLVNGRIRVLEHKDEILVGSQQLFFSSDLTPVVETYTHNATPRRPRCPVCRGEILDGQQIVRCPGCSRIHHQIDDTADSPGKPCWTYSPQCRFCQHPTSLSGDQAWRPEEQDFFAISNVQPASSRGN